MWLRCNKTTEELYKTNFSKNCKCSKVCKFATKWFKGKLNISLNYR